MSGFSEAMINLLAARGGIEAAREKLDGIFNGDTEQLFPELKRLADLERKLFRKVQKASEDWEKP